MRSLCRWGVWTLASALVTGGGGSLRAQPLIDLLNYEQVPELSEGPPAGEEWKPLVQALDLAGEGEVERGIAELERLGTADVIRPPLRLAALLLAPYLIRHRFDYLGGDARAQSETNLESQRAQRRINDLGQRLDRLQASLSPEDSALAMRARLYDFYLFRCLDGSPQLIRSYELNKKYSPVPVAPPPLVGIPTAEQCRSQLEIDLPPLARETLLDLVAARFAMAETDPAKPAESLARAAARARAAGSACLAGRLLLRQGDDRAALSGSVLTLGFDLGFESTVRTELGAGRMPPEALPPAPGVLAEAETLYRQADDLLKTCGRPAPASPYLLRRAYLSFLRGEETAAQAYLDAAAAARSEGSPRVALLAEASNAILTASTDRFATTFNTFMQRGDFQGALSSAEMARSFAVRSFYLRRQLFPAIPLLSVATRSLQQQGWPATAALFAQQLGQIQQWAGNFEAAAAIAREAAGWQRSFVDCTARLALPQPNGCEWPPGTLETEKAILYSLLQSQMGALTLLGFRDRRLSWLRDVEEAKVERAALAQGFAGDPVLGNLLTGLVPKMEGIYASAPYQTQLVSDLSSLRECSRRAQLIRQARSRPGYDPESAERLVGLLEVSLSWCDPGLAQDVRSRLEREDPVKEIRALRLDSPPQKPSATAALLVAGMKATSLFEQAARMGSFDRLGLWCDALAEAIHQNPGLSSLGPAVQYYRSLVLRSRGDLQGALSLQRELVTQAFTQGATFFLLDPTLVLVAQMDTEIALGDAEAALLDWWRLQEIRRRAVGAATGIDSGSPASAELAMLNRMAASGVGLSPEQESRRTLLQIQSHAPAPDPSWQIDAPRLRRVLESLPHGTVGLVYFFGPGSMAAWRLERGAPVRLVRLSGKPGEVLELAETLRWHLRGGLEGWETAAARLDEILVQPLGGFPEGARLAVLTYGLLSDLPFSLLGPASGPRLGDRHPIFNVDWLALPASAERPPGSSGPALVVGVNSRELTQAEHEASEVASRLHTQPLLGNRATAAEVGPRLTSARILHFATHGILDGENPYRSRLSLANGDSLEGWWLFQQPLEADLVVLSACNSAQRQMLAGDVLGNGSERLSLTAALNARGVGAVVASWWRVNDAGAEALMEKFYEELTRETNEDPVLALYQAKLAVGSDPWQLNSNAAFQVFISSLVRLPGNPRSTTNPAL